MYVSEPETIDLDVVRQSLDGSGVEFVAGTKAFDGSSERQYDVLLIRSATKVDDTIKTHFSGLKAIVRAGVGLDNVDLEYCKREGIAVYNAPGANADAVSEYVVAMVLHVLRNISKLNLERVRDWDRFAFRGSSIREHTVGIIGFGNIGRLVYEKLNVFSVPEFLVYDPYVTPESIQAENVRLTTLDEVLKRSTILSVHVPLTNETRHLIHEENLSLMQDGSLLVNAARGGVVDEPAVIAHAMNGGVTYVADTVENEPNVDERLLGHENIIITPHIGSLTSSSEKEMVRQAINNYLNGVAAAVV